MRLPNTDALSGDSEFVLESTSGPEGENLFIPVFFGLILFLTGFAFGNVDLYAIPIHIMDAIAAVGAIVAFWLLRTLRRFTFRQTLITNVILWYVAGACAAITPDIALFVVTGSVPESLLSQLPLGLISYPVLMAIAALGVSNWQSSQIRLAELRKKRRELAQRQYRLNDEVSLIRGAMKQEIREQLQAALEETESQLRSGGRSSNLYASTQLRVVIDNVLRPLSWTLSSDSTSSTVDVAFTDSMTSDIPGTVKEQRLRSAFTMKVALARLTAPRLFFFAAVIFVVPASIYVDGVTGGLSALLSLLINVGLLSLIRYSGRSPLINPWVGAVILSVTTAVASLISPALFELSGLSLEYLSGVVAGFFMMGLFSSVLMAFATMRLQHIHESVDLNERLEHVVNDLRQQIWVAKSELAKTVHGTVQSKLLVASLKLAFPDGESNITQAALRDIQEALSSIEGGDEPQQISISEALSNLKSSWAGACEISIDVTASTCELIDQDPIARACVMEVLRENAANAAKHSKSPMLNIQVTAFPGEDVMITTRSRGKLDVKGSPGYGTQIIAAATSVWDLTQVGAEVELNATVTLNPSR